MLNAGLDGLTLVELDQSGNARHPEGLPFRGSHRDRFFALNVLAQPGHHYMWALERDPGQCISFQTHGWEFIRFGDPEFPPDHLLARDAGPDTLLRFGELVAMRITDEAYARYQETYRVINERQLKGAGGEFMAKPHPQEFRYQGRGPTRYDTGETRIYTTSDERGVWQEE